MSFMKTVVPTHKIVTFRIHYRASCKAVSNASFPPIAALSSIIVAIWGANQPAVCRDSIDLNSASKLGHCNASIPDEVVPE